jgi:hypothetical protein
VQQNPLQSAAAGKICGKRLAARYSSSLRGAVDGPHFMWFLFLFGVLILQCLFCGHAFFFSHACTFWMRRLERERKEKEAAAMAAAGIKGKRR